LSLYVTIKIARQFRAQSRDKLAHIKERKGKSRAWRYVAGADYDRYDNVYRGLT